MSRIGKKPIEIPSGVEAVLKQGTIGSRALLVQDILIFQKNLRWISLITILQ